MIRETFFLVAISPASAALPQVSAELVSTGGVGGGAHRRHRLVRAQGQLPQPHVPQPLARAHRCSGYLPCTAFLRSRGALQQVCRHAMVEGLFVCVWSLCCLGWGCVNLCLSRLWLSHCVKFLSRLWLLNCCPGCDCVKFLLSRLWLLNFVDQAGNC